ncbi:MAG: hypothetical protein PHQ40_05595 [Anaerolineaceae bacterium]|nr:hypothetical protein [Anaerolineaceae bacterium]
MLVNRYLHLFKTTAFAEDKFDIVYGPIDRWIYSEKLDLDICVPILFQKFSFTHHKIDKFVSIEKMDEDFHRARATRTAYNRPIHRSVYSSASHMLVIRIEGLPNTNYWELTELLREVDHYPLGFINSFFAANRIVIGEETGYAQVLIRPVEWAMSYKAHLPPLEGTSIKVYPSIFENDYWWSKEDLPVLDEKTVERIGKYCLDLFFTHHNQLCWRKTD